jgi:type III secretory pathway component EscV
MENIMNALLELKIKLNRMKHWLSDKFGDRIWLILSSTSFFLVTCALLLGLFKKMWFIAWIFVILGALLIVFPVMNLRSNNKKSKGTDSDSLLQSQPKSISPSITMDQIDQDIKLTMEFEAALLRRNILDKEAERKEAERKEEENRNAESLKKAFEKHQKEVEEKKRLKMLKEKREFQQRNFNQNYFRKETIKNYSYIRKSNQCNSEFFKGIHNITELKKRYFDLMKIYHPDNSSGDIKVTQKIQQEYEKLLLQFELPRNYNK